MYIETERLKIQPLTEAQLKLYAANNGSLEKSLGLRYTPKPIDPDLADALENYFLRLIPLHREQYYFYTLWTIELKATQTLAGDLCFKGEPDETGEVEIGYGTYPDFQQQGIMSEAIEGLLLWCFKRPDISSVIAETETGNTASEKILERNGFSRDTQGRDNTWWKREVRELVM
ncbi:GNAT family N-acetyltransferase [Rufibacter sediminis]|uniref:GNAT family N-acetyltransferase n=1 Tax=Rufibacter sediminis TaxID=2762756 RepID=A0ABR6VT57_9BACT|nr:GNAT family N-acetyltransferase [Rufibacter sediminis]MBC3539781.1 GNAT family N-acetyltransferase [Rufibacter sediminis]